MWTVELNRFLFFFPLILCVPNSTENTDLEVDTKLAVDQVDSQAKVSPAPSVSSLYTSDKFYSDAESDDEYKDPLPDYHPFPKSHYHVSLFILFVISVD